MVVAEKRGKMSQSRKKVKKLQKQRQQKHQETAKRREMALHQQAEQVHDEVLEDMLPLVSRFGGLSSGSAASMDKLMMLLLDTYDLADEPEMAGILFDPIQVTEVFGKVAQEMGFLPEKMETLPQEEREDAQMAMLEKTVEQLLTADICQDILKRLDNLRLRLKRLGKKKDTAKVAALLSFLREDKKRASWPMFGLVQALVQRHLNLGFDLMDLAMTAGPDFKEEANILEDNKPKKPGLMKKFRTLLKTPGLRDYLEKQAEKTWKEGVDAVFAGDLSLTVYSEEEIEAGYEIIAKASGYDSAEAMEAASPSRKLSNEKAMDIFAQLDSYITEIFTSARLKQLRGRIDTLWKDPQYKDRWAPFLAMLKGNLEDKKAVEYEMKFFIAALFGELQATAKEKSKSGG